MSVEPETKSLSPTNLDLAGLPAPVAEELRRLVETLRSNLGHAPTPQPAGAESSELWARRLQSWIDSHPARSCTLDDDREGVYAGRDE